VRTKLVSRHEVFSVLFKLFFKTTLKTKKLHINIMQNSFNSFNVSLHTGRVLPCMGYKGMCGPKGYGFSAVLVINRVSILAILVITNINRVWLLHSCLELGMSFRRSYFFIIIDKTITEVLHNIMFRATVPATTVINRISNFLSSHK